MGQKGPGWLLFKIELAHARVDEPIIPLHSRSTLTRSSQCLLFKKN